MTKKRLLFVACMLCMLATLLLIPIGLTLPAKADAVAPNNAILRDDNGEAPTDLEFNWTYGDDDNIPYAFRPEHGDTVYYTINTKVSDENDEIVDKEYERFAVKYIGETAMFYVVKDGEIDTDTPFKAQSLNAYLKTLKAGDYSLNVSAPSGTVSDEHTHWWGNGSCDITSYSAATLNDVKLTVSAYELDETCVGDSDSSMPVKYTIITPNVDYTGKANNVPKIELTFNGNTLVEGEDYTLSDESAVNVGDATRLKITGMGGFTGEVTIENAYNIVKAYNTISDVYVVRWKYGEYDRNVNRFTAHNEIGNDLYFTIATDTTGSQESIVDGLEKIRLTDGMVSPQVEQLLNKLDANKVYFLYATDEGGDNYYYYQTHTQFDIVEVTNTWKTIPNVVSWEWHGFDQNVNAVNAVPAFGDSVTFTIYTKKGDEYTALKFGEKESFELEDGDNGKTLPASVVNVLSNLDAGTYYLFASVISDTDNYSSINEKFNVDALVPFRVLQARNYWTQLPKLSNWAYGEYNPEVNVVAAASAHGSSGIKYRVYRPSGNKFELLNFSGVTSFYVNAQGAIPKAVSDGFKALHVGKYYLRAEVEATDNYTGLLQTVADFSELPSFEVIKAENYWSTSPAINAWAKGKYSNDDNLPVAAAHHGVARIVIVDVDDEENIVYDSANNINKLSEAKVGAYLLTATVAGTDNYGELTFNVIFRVFVPETETVGMAWWLVLIIVICSLGVLVFIFWLLHDKGILQMLSSKAVVAMRTKATMDATIAAIRANKLAEEAKESVRLAEELEKLEAEKAETEEDDSDEEEEAILVERDEESGFATFVRYQRPFSVKLIQATDEAKERYSRLKNVLLSYRKVKSKTSKGYDAFNCGRVQLAKLVIRGKTLCLYLALNPDEFEDTKYKVERSKSKKFADTPCLYRIKSPRRLGYAEDLIRHLCDMLEIAQGEVKDVDYRPPYESTEDLLEKGLIKKITYQRRINSDANDNQGASAEPKVEDQPDQTKQEVAATDAVVEEKAEDNTAVSEKVPAATEETSAESDANAETKKTTTKKTTRSKKNVAKK